MMRAKSGSFGLPPQKGYVRLWRRYVSKPFLYGLLLAGFAAGYAFVLAAYPALMNAYYERIAVPTFALDSPYLAQYTGRARLVLPSGELLYEGDIAQAIITGNGVLYQDGAVRYSGAFVEGIYNGAGMLYASSGALVYEGAFANNLYEGQGKLYEAGHLRYSGDFVAGVFEGMGRLYASASAAPSAARGPADGVLIYEGAFVGGLYSGMGTEYDPKTGLPLFKGVFLNGERTAEGTLYDENGEPVVTVPTYADPTTLLGADYKEVTVDLVKKSVAYQELAVGDRHLVAEEESGVILAFVLDEAGAPTVVGEVYLTGLSAVGDFVVGGQIGPGNGEAVKSSAAEEYVLALANKAWGREVTMSDLEMRRQAVKGLTADVFYLPVQPQAADADATDADATDADAADADAAGAASASAAPASAAPAASADSKGEVTPDPSPGGTVVFLKIHKEPQK
jgi:hypothetical protein